MATSLLDFASADATSPSSGERYHTLTAAVNNDRIILGDSQDSHLPKLITKANYLKAYEIFANNAAFSASTRHNGYQGLVSSNLLQWIARNGGMEIVSHYTRCVDETAFANITEPQQNQIVFIDSLGLAVKYDSTVGWHQVWPAEPTTAASPTREIFVADSSQFPSASLNNLANGQAVINLGHASAADSGGGTHIYRSTGKSSLTAAQLAGPWYHAANGADDYVEAVDKRFVRFSQLSIGTADDTAAILDLLAAVYTSSTSSDPGVVVEVDTNATFTDKFFLAGKVLLRGTPHGELYLNNAYTDGVANETKFLIPVGITSRGQAYSAADEATGGIEGVRFRLGPNARVNRWLNILAAKNYHVKGCQFIANEFGTGIPADQRVRGAVSMQNDAAWIVGGPSPSSSISGASNANPVVLTVTGHGFKNGDYIRVSGMSGMTELNLRGFHLINVTTNTVALQGEDGTGHGTYTSGGTAALGHPRVRDGVNYIDNLIDVVGDTTVGGEGLSMSNAWNSSIRGNTILNQIDDSIGLHQCVNCPVEANIIESVGASLLDANGLGNSFVANTVRRIASVLDGTVKVGALMRCLVESTVTNATEALTIEGNTFYLPAGSTGSYAVRLLIANGVSVKGNTLVSPDANNFIVAEAGATDTGGSDWFPPNERYDNTRKQVGPINDIVIDGNVCTPGTVGTIGVVSGGAAVPGDIGVCKVANNIAGAYISSQAEPSKISWVNNGTLDGDGKKFNTVAKRDNMDLLAEFFFDSIDNTLPDSPTETSASHQTIWTADRAGRILRFEVVSDNDIYTAGPGVIILKCLKGVTTVADSKAVNEVFEIIDGSNVESDPYFFARGDEIKITIRKQVATTLTGSANITARLFGMLE